MRSVTVVVWCLATAEASAGSPSGSDEARGLAVAQEVDRRDSGFGDYSADLTMVLRNRHGQEARRRLRVRILEQHGDGDKGWVQFDEPADVKGTALLTFSHKTGNDDQWLYLPAVNRVKRISSTNKSGPFMGSEFAFEDISSQELEEFSWRYLREEVLDGQTCHVLERRPLDPRSGYTRQVVWIDREAYRTLRIEYYDRKDQLLKTQRLLDYELQGGRFWRPGRTTMDNHQTGKSTEVLWRKYVFAAGLKDVDFDPQRLSIGW